MAGTPSDSELAGSGMTTRQMAAELTARGIPTALGARWHPQTVKRVMERCVAKGDGLA